MTVIHSPTIDRAGNGQNTNASLAIQAYVEAGCGTKGAEVVMPSHYGVQNRGAGANKYVVTHHMRMDEEILIRLECLPSPECDEPAVLADKPYPAKRILLQFDGGALDGIRLDSHSHDCDEALAAAACLLTLEEVADGRGCIGMPLAAWKVRKRQLGDGGARAGKGHKYRVASRNEDESQQVVTLRHVDVV